MVAQIELSRQTPEAQGVASEGISAFIEATAQHKLELHSLMLLRHGQVIAEGWWSPYGPDKVHLLYSLSKSFTATAVGLAVAEGRLSLDDPVLKFFPDKSPAQPGEHLTAMRVHHLLSMGTGHVEDTLERLIETEPEDWVRGFLALPPDQAPGTVFTYNNGATFMLSAIVQAVTGEKLIDYLHPRLLEPLGIRQAYWHENPQGINLGFSDLHITTESIARFGQLYLQQGQWQGRQLLPEGWADLASRSHIVSSSPGDEDNTDWAQGYGYQFWRCRHNSYRGDGAFGQFCVVMPEQDAVLAITSAVGDMQAVLDLAWDHLLPAMATAELPANPAANQTLQATLAALQIDPVKGPRTSPLAELINGRTYHFQPEPAIAGRGTLPPLTAACLNLQAQPPKLMLESGDERHYLEIGRQHWLSGYTTFNPGSEPTPVVTSGAWTAEDTFTVALRYIETPHCLTLACRFVGEVLHIDRSWNVSFGPTVFPTLTGKRTVA